MKEKKGMESCRGPPKGPFLPRQILQRKEEYDGNLSHAHRQPAAAVFAHLHPQAEVPDGPRLHPPRGHRPGHLPVPCPLGGRGGIQAPHGGGARLSWGAGGAVQLSPSAQAQAQAGAGFPAHAGELPAVSAVAGPALGKPAGRPAHPASSPAAGPQPPDPPPLDKGGPPPGSAGGTEPAVQQGGAPRFFGHAGESAGVPGVGGGFFGGDAINSTESREKASG